MTTMGGTARPDKHAVLSKLKGFQRRTVEHVVRRLFDTDGSRRFLVADEVGLGKTLIARGVVAEIVDRLWEDVGRVDILYVCSNAALASENLRKIHLGGKTIAGTRLTLLPKELPNFDPKLNFVSFTPGTALNVVGTGRVDERVVLFALLKQRYGSPAWLMNLLQGDVTVDNWRERHLKGLPDLDDGQTQRFLKRLEEHPTLRGDLEWAGETLLRWDSQLDKAARSRRYKLVGDLRRLLAHSCIDALEVDLIVLDEFQRFKDLLPEEGGERTDLTDLTDALFHYKGPEGKKVATLLLSATPYRMYATDDEAGSGDHYADFLDTLRFLCDNSGRFEEMTESLERYRKALLGAASGSAELVTRARDDLQRLLKNVMVRTERVDSTEDRNAMVEEPPIRVPVTRRDLAHYVATEELAEHLGSRDMVEFWKSAPYLFNFMKKYRVKEDFEEQRHLKAVRECFRRVASEFLSVAQVQAYETIDPANARLRALAKHALGDDQASMLWLPPTLPYWPLARSWARSPLYSKKLVFSAWNVVPDAVSALLSYEAERRMIGEKPAAPYAEFYRRRRPLLRYATPDGRAANMTTLALSVPCLALADGISPLAIALQGRPVFETVREQVDALVETLTSLAGEGGADPRWHWAAPFLLDQHDATMREVLDHWVAETGDDDGDDETEADAATAKAGRGARALNAHLDEAARVLDGEITLGAIPPTLVDVLTELALGGPAVLVARSLLRKDVSPLVRRRAAVRVANGFRSLFNQPPVIHLLRAESEDDEGYWRSTLRYAIDGNLQAVLDEQVHLLWEQHAWNDPPADDICLRVARDLEDSVTTKVSRVSPDLYASGERKIEDSTAQDGAGAPERISLRTSFALRYGTVTGTSGAIEHREESVRTAFKSPFFPFVLVSTSIGQEGLDFHPWCHEIWHWNLPGNPVDLEQREGRVHRYKGLAVRKNVAEGAFETLRTRWAPGVDPWEELFRAAEDKHAHTSELVPHWIAPGPHKVQRCVPALPFSSEIDQLRRLKRSLAIYRVVFGQPRQEELLALLERSELTREELETWTVSLRPG